MLQDTGIKIAVLVAAALGFAAAAIALGRREGESALKSLDKRIVAFASVFWGPVIFFRHSVLAWAVTLTSQLFILFRIGRRRNVPRPR